MKIIQIILLSILLFGCKTTPVVNETAKPQFTYNEAEYETQYERVLSQSKDADFTKLRIAYTDTKNYKPYKATPNKEMFGAMKSGDHKKCLNTAEAYFVTDYVSIPAHFAAMVCRKELGNQKESDYHKYVLDGIMDSIADSGDGKSAETAFVIISGEELYAFLDLSGLKVKGQSLIRGDNGRAYDLMKVINPRTNEEFGLYFDITLQMAKGMKFLR